MECQWNFISITITFLKNHPLNHIWIIDREVKIIKFRGDPSKMSGNVEVRGIVNKDGTISYGEYTQYDNEFGKFNLLK